MSTPETSSIDILTFDAVKACENGFEFQLIGEDGETKTGVFLTVLGKHADPVNKWINKTINDTTKAQIMAMRKQKNVDPKSLDDIKAQNIEAALVRVVGWRNVKQEFTKDLMRQVLQRNPHFVDQIIDTSDDLANFSKAQ